MTGILQAVAAAGAGPQSGTAVVADSKAGTPAVGTLQLRADGSINNGGIGSSTTPPNWYTPVGTAPTMYATFTNTSGTAPTVGGGAGSPLAPTLGAPFFQWATTTTPQTISAAGNIKIYSDAGGANLVGTFTYTVNVQRTS